jgi:hypothetical protein
MIKALPTLNGPWGNPQSAGVTIASGVVQLEWHRSFARNALLP